MTLATISVVSHGHGALLHQALDDLSAQDRMEHCDLVVTLNLRDEPFDPARWPRLRINVLRNERPLGFGSNHNRAFVHCTAPWFVVLNPDIRLPERGALAALVAQPPSADVGVVAPLVTDSAGVPEDAVRTLLTPWSLLQRAQGRRRRHQADSPARQGRPFYWLAGMCLVASAEAYRHVGGFDERFFLYCEDYDLCARLYLAGYELRVRPDVHVVHDAQRDSHRSSRHLRWHVGSLLRVWTSAAFWRLLVQPGR